MAQNIHRKSVVKKVGTIESWLGADNDYGQLVAEKQDQKEEARLKGKLRQGDNSKKKFFSRRKCLFVHSVCKNFSLNTHSVCTNFSLDTHSVCTNFT